MLKLYFLFYKTLKKELKCGVRLETFIVVKKKKRLLFETVQLSGIFLF